MPRYAEQDVDEVWFAGCHSDVVGGDCAYPTANIALRWMLGEATHVPGGIQLNMDGHSFLEESDAQAPTVHESKNPGWWIAEHIPRKEIDNSGVYPVKRWAWGSNGMRKPEKLRRGGLVRVHLTAADLHSIPGQVDICYTRRLPKQDLQ
ncbi:phospholipase effector Tle1 domain-containing protein [Streptomyces sp. NPDC102476]|uniref:phospholipase effector Tle1 domain-containing protein n=1 Tax=Streptomyces sp. NPDC102476 TaxID=3366181 RepID=UPI00380B6A1E